MFLQDGAVGQLAPVHSGGGRRFESYSCYKVNQKRLFFKKQPKMVDKCRISVMVAFDPSKVTVTVRICYPAQFRSVEKLADSQHLGCCASCVWVRVPPLRLI